jgi:hypothetical protein
MPSLSLSRERERAVCFYGFRFVPRRFCLGARRLQRVQDAPQAAQHGRPAPLLPQLQVRRLHLVRKLLICGETLLDSTV